MNQNESTDAVDEAKAASTEKRRDANPISNRPMGLEDIEKAYENYAGWVERFGWLDRLLTGRYRRRQFGNVAGRVLDVACGTGTNFRYLPDSVELVGIDISEEMLSRGRDELDRLHRDGRLTRMDAQDLEFEDDSFDTVISSLSTCTFPDPVAALREMERVCKPGGEIRLVEHGRSDVGLIARYQEWRADSHYEKAGCRMTQEPLAVVRQAGLDVDSAENGQLGRITTIVCASSTTRERSSCNRSEGEP